MPSSSSGSGLPASGRRPASSSLEHLGAGGAVELGVRRTELADPVEQLADGVVVLRGVLADVEGGQGETGGGDGADQSLDLPSGDHRALVVEHGAVQQQQVVEQLGVVARSRGPATVPVAADEPLARSSPSRTWTQVRNSR